MSFVHLHLHTEYSLLDGATRIEELPAFAKKMGQDSVAITDHGNMFGAVDFYRACKKEGVKPIIGCEVYVANRTRFDKEYHIDLKSYHLILLCENETGYHNLIQLVSQGYIEGFYKRPRVDWELLAKHHEGLICLSACLAGEIPKALLAQNPALAKKTALRLQEIYGKENFFIELQNHGLLDQTKILPDLVRLSKEIDAGLVATNDVHYLKKEDAHVQKVMLCIQTGRTLNEENDFAFSTEEFYLKSEDQMRALFQDFPEAIENSGKIAARCQFKFSFGNTVWPYFKAPNHEDNRSYFLRLCEEGLKRRYSETPSQNVMNRYRYELGVIEQMGYINYFLIVYDFVNYAKTHDIPVGPGRGSGAGCLIAYCLGITEIDPIAYDLLFERFLNPERISMPDFDIDFCNEKRQLVIDYVNQKYGSDHVAQIITFGTMAAKGAIRDAGRVMGLPYREVDRIARLIPNQLNITIDAALLESADLKKLYGSDEQCRNLLDTARKLEGLPRNASTHAAGVVITREQVNHYVPLALNDDLIVTQYTMNSLADIGLLKMDFLGLRNLTVIRYAQEAIQKTCPDFQVDRISTADTDTFEMLSHGQSEGVFQLESAGMKQLLKRMKPQSLEDIIAAISLYRPGPARFIDAFLTNRLDPTHITYLDESLRDILDVTFGIIIYQEQVMQIFRKLAGYSLARADLVRRAISKKDIKVMQQERDYFIHGKVNEDGTTECPGAVKNGVPEKVAAQIFENISNFASYAFNKSHAAAYSLISYQTAYLKCHYPREYMAALLNSVIDMPDKMRSYMAVCKRASISILPPDINRSQMLFCVENNQIRFGLLAIKNVGEHVIQKIIAIREQNGPYLSLEDFIKRTIEGGINKLCITALIHSGSMDSFPENRKQMVGSVPTLLDSVSHAGRSNITGQINLFEMAQGTPQAFVYPNISEYAAQELLEMEHDSTGLYITSHPLDQYTSLLSHLNYTPIAEILKDAQEDSFDPYTVSVQTACVVSKVKIKSTRAKKTMANITLEDQTDTIGCIAFPTIFERFGMHFKNGALLLLQGKIEKKENAPISIVCSYATPLSDVDTDYQKQLFLKLDHVPSDVIQQIEDTLGKNGGFGRVTFYDAHKKLYIPYAKGVRLTPELIKTFQDLLGEKQVVLKE